MNTFFMKIQISFMFFRFKLKENFSTENVLLAPGNGANTRRLKPPSRNVFGEISLTSTEK